MRLILPLLLSILVAIAVLPLMAIVFFAFTGGSGLWPHLLATVLPVQLMQTLLFMAGSGAGALIVGSGAAWIVSSQDFPLRRLIAIALILPLAVPPWLAGYAYADLLDYAGPLQSHLRNLMGWKSPADYFFPPIRSLWGACFVMSFSLYPYVYLPALVFFSRPSVRLLEAARVLGLSARHSFWRIALPLARPALAAGLALVLMECLNDIGLVEHFGVRTLTSGVYDVWLQRGDLGGGAQIALTALLMAASLFALERLARRRQRFHARGQSPAPPPRTGSYRTLAFCLIPIFLGFAVPVAFFAFLALQSGEMQIPALFESALRSLALAAAAALIIGCGGLLLALAGRLTGTRAAVLAAQTASLGYAMPGSVLALGVLAALALWTQWSGWSALMAGGYGALLIAYFVRFLALPYRVIESGLARQSPHLDSAAQTLGAPPFLRLWRVHLPLLKGALLAGGFFVFAEVMRELPATLILRPFNAPTLATEIYAAANLGLLHQSAPAALFLSLIGLIAAFLWALPLFAAPRKAESA